MLFYHGICLGPEERPRQHCPHAHVSTGGPGVVWSCFGSPPRLCCCHVMWLPWASGHVSEPRFLICERGAEGAGSSGRFEEVAGPGGAPLTPCGGRWGRHGEEEAEVPEGSRTVSLWKAGQDRTGPLWSGRGGCRAGPHAGGWSVPAASCLSPANPGRPTSRREDGVGWGLRAHRAPGSLS